VNALSSAGLDLTNEDVREHLALQAGIPDAIEVKPEPDPMGLMASTNVPTGPKGKEGDDAKPNREGTKDA